MLATVACGQPAAGTPSGESSASGAAPEVTTPGAGTQSPAPPAQPVLRDIGGVADLESLFNQDAGGTRLILLLSPT